ncbi:hypothetical protein [Zobellia laminariae]|uniref:hypothetical protein n=1 Tax=Zobellia laminariae TaxID=248906 RepID=UPI0026F47C51|nr:hypothetical protein [Zobellia laminariae]WKX77417.1 hypothetical protein Q5W13_05015 [Zobellia laminariae]
MNTEKLYIRLKKGFALLTVVFFAVSCEDYLEEQPSTLIDSDYIYTTEEGLKSGVVSLYKFNRDRYDNGTEDFMGAVLMSSRSDLAFSRTGYTGLMGRYERGVSPVDQVPILYHRYFGSIFITLPIRLLKSLMPPRN